MIFRLVTSEIYLHLPWQCIQSLTPTPPARAPTKTFDMINLARRLSLLSSSRVDTWEFAAYMRGVLGGCQKTGACPCTVLLLCTLVTVSACIYAPTRQAPHLLKKFVILWLPSPALTGLPFVPLLVALLVCLPAAFSGEDIVG